MIYIFEICHFYLALPWKRENSGFHGNLIVTNWLIKKVIHTVYEELIILQYCQVWFKFEKAEVGQTHSPRLRVYPFSGDFSCIFFRFLWTFWFLSVHGVLQYVIALSRTIRFSFRKKFLKAEDLLSLAYSKTISFQLVTKSVYKNVTKC